MFLPKSKYKIKQASWGMFKLSGSRNEGFYVGPYIEDYLGRTYAGSSLEGAEDRVLIPTKDRDVKVQKIKVNILPKESDYETGSVVRYFRQNNTTKVVEEIDREKSLNKGNYKTISGSWILVGPLDDQKIYGHTYLGTRSRNQATLDLWEKEIPGISEALNLKPEDLVKI